MKLRIIATIPIIAAALKSNSIKPSSSLVTLIPTATPIIPIIRLAKTRPLAAKKHSNGILENQNIYSTVSGSNPRLIAIGAFTYDKHLDIAFVNNPSTDEGFASCSVATDDFNLDNR
ncbi:unnamed protein product [Rotaria sordida]|uniref:Uncharacterized protein n=1 Tax=Rotaria sordida TaxID=392033 RepID=A0A815LJ26_9BILA|nr:unnamed protein product [Rotaria sordida]